MSPTSTTEEILERYNENYSEIVKKMSEFTCLNYSYSVSALERHKQECKKIATTMALDYDSALKFKNFNHKLDVLFVFYADFECILEPLDIQNSANVKSVQKRSPFAFSHNEVRACDHRHLTGEYRRPAHIVVI